MALGHAAVRAGHKVRYFTAANLVETIYRALASLRPFHNRPARVLGAGRFAAASLERMDDPVLTRLPLVGAVDQLLDCTDVLAHPALTSPMRCLYDALAAENPR